MPKSNHMLTLGWTGTLDKTIVFRQRNGKTIISKYPDMSNRKLTEKQLQVNKTMKHAVKYVQDLLADERSRNEAQVRLDVPRNKLYNALIKEFYAKNYTPLKDGDKVEPDPDFVPPLPQATYDFVKYLVENTEKSIAEIAEITGVSISALSVFQDQFRKEKPIIFPDMGKEKGSG